MDPKIEDGYACLWTFADFPTISLYEIETTPPGWDAGGPINTTTMRNTTLRTFAPKKLKSLTAGGGTVAFSDTAFDTTTVEAMIGHKQLITCELPTGATYSFWGWLDRWTPGGFREGDMPTATISIVPANENNSNVETLPTFTP